MKRITSLVLTIALVIAAIPTAFAYVPGGNLCIAQHDGSEEYSGIECCAICDWCPVCEGECDCLAPVDYSIGTQVEYIANADANREYTITVPAKMTPKLGQAVTGTVTLSGMWASNETVTVTADAEVELTNSINENDKHTLAITFPKMEYAGDNTETKTYTETVTLAEMPSAALFGEWTGKFNYNVEFKAPAKLISFTIDGTQYQAEEGMTWEQWVNSESNTINASIVDGKIKDDDKYIFVNSADSDANVVSSTSVISADNTYVLGTYPVVKLITFTLDGLVNGTYQAEEGMTWAEWVVSAYNTANLKEENGFIFDEWGSSFMEHSPSDEIINGNTYYFTTYAQFCMCPEPVDDDGDGFCDYCDFDIIN